MNMLNFKTILIVVGCGLLLAGAARAQTTNAPRTELDAFEAGTDTVIVRGSADLGAVTTAAGTVSVRCKESVEAGSGRKKQGLAVTLTGPDQQSDTTIVDYAEMDSLLSGLELLSQANWSLTTLPAFDAVYTTRDGLQAAVYSSRNQPGTIGASLKSSRTVKVRISLAPEEFAQFRGLIQQAKTKLDALHGAK
jgi:hypothetical protein